MSEIAELDHQYTKMYDDVDDREIDVESDEDDHPTSDHGGSNSTNKRAHHNALERKRRDHIKESFNSLRDTIPALKGEKSSRAQILNKATECIELMRRKNISHQHDIDDLKRQNRLLDQQIQELERIHQKHQNAQDMSSELESDDSPLRDELQS